MNRHFSRFQARYQGLSDDEYIEEAVSYAESKIIPSFVDRLMDNLNIDRDGSCSNLMHLSILDAILDNATSDISDTEFGANGDIDADSLFMTSIEIL